MGYKSHAQRKAVHASKAEQKAKKGASMKKYGASKKEFPEIKKGNEGKFTKWVEKNMPGMDTCKAASKIMRSKTKKYSSSVVKMANYANNFGCKTKKEGGASFNPKLRKAVADGKIKGKFADAVMGASMKGNPKEGKKELKMKRMEEKTKRIGIRQGEKTRRVEARNKKDKTKETLQKILAGKPNQPQPGFKSKNEKLGDVIKLSDGRKVRKR